MRQNPPESEESGRQGFLAENTRVTKVDCENNWHDSFPPLTTHKTSQITPKDIARCSSGPFHIKSVVRRRVSASLDENLLAKTWGTSSIGDEGVVAHLSSLASSDGPGEALAAEKAVPDYGKSFERSTTPPGQRAWPGDQHDGRLHGRDEGRPATPAIPATVRSRLRAFRDALRVTTPGEHGQTAFSREYIQFTNRRGQWRPPRNTFNYRGRHPFEEASGAPEHSGQENAKEAKHFDAVHDGIVGGRLLEGNVVDMTSHPTPAIHIA